MNIPIEVVSDPFDWAGWAQALFGGGAIIATWVLASTEARRARKDRDDRAEAQRTAICAIIDLAVETLSSLDKKATDKKFTIGNIGASEDAADASIASLASIPLLELTTVQIKVVSATRGHMTTARRRLGFNRNHLDAGTTPNAQFGSLLRQVKTDREKL
ncbi:hypothetical protein [Brevundimonas vesicularis]|uniref:hypothetical protein n=1 Tax=Brevundimonas vesicularis TaxID=41276 RepID=UPI0011B008E5|nr:hypothetical protein [Brevundimonas vesicularis]